MEIQNLMTEEERTEAFELLKSYYPSSYIVKGDNLHKILGPFSNKNPMTGDEVLSALEGLEKELVADSNQATALLKSISSEHRICEECSNLYVVKRKKQRFCPGGKCSNRWHQRAHKERNKQ